MVPDVVYICNIMVTIFQHPGCDVYRRSEQRRGARRVGFYERGKEFLSIKSIKSKVGKCLTDCLWSAFSDLFVWNAKPLPDIPVIL